MSVHNIKLRGAQASITSIPHFAPLSQPTFNFSRPFFIPGAMNLASSDAADGKHEQLVDFRSELKRQIHCPCSLKFRTVTYNVVGFPDTDTESFGVLINGKITTLSTSPDTFPLWSGIAPGALESGYQYVKLSEQGTVQRQEPFLRFSENGIAKSTTNEFFLRQTTRTALPKLPQVFDNVQPEASKAFDDSQIATIHLTPDPDEFEDMVANPLDDKRIKAGFRFVSADTVYSAKEVKVKVSGRDTRHFQKLSFRIKFDRGDTFFDRPIIKVRSGVFDPTMIREKLYIDILNAIGVRTTQGAWVRVYVNGKPFGFYIMVEDIEPPFLRGTMHHGNIQPVQLGSLYKLCDTRPIPAEDEATLQFSGSKTTDYNKNVYENQNLGANPTNEPMAQLILFLQDLHNRKTREHAGR